MKVTVAKSSGFCFGVKNAVDTAVSIAGDKSETRKKVLLGEIVHNQGSRSNSRRKADPAGEEL